MAALDQLMSSMPVANQRRQQQAQAATDLQLQQAIKQVPPKAATPQVAQVLGAAAQQSTGQQMIDTAKQNLQTTQQVGALAANEQATQLKQSVDALRRGQDTQQLSDEQAFASLSEDAKREMFDGRMQFQKDESGRQFMNERQLADYAVTHARDQQQLMNYTQQAEQMHNRKIQMMETAQKKLSQELEFQNSLSEQKQDQSLKRQLIEAKRQMEEKIAREKADRANRAGKFAAVGGIVGGVVGAAVGGPVGAAVGYSAGSALGGMAAAQTE